MTAKRQFSNPVPVSDLTAAILDPLLRKRMGISVALVQSWEEIAGDRLAKMSRPQKIAWPRRQYENDPFEPATLIVACEGSAALRLQHETAEIISRVNSFLGFTAIARIRILQRPVDVFPAKRRYSPRPLAEAEVAAVARTVAGVEDEGLRSALERLGRTIRAEKK